MSGYLAATLMSVSACVAVELVALVWRIKSPSWKVWRWWAAYVAVLICAQISFYLGTVTR